MRIQMRWRAARIVTQHDIVRDQRISEINDANHPNLHVFFVPPKTRDDLPGLYNADTLYRAPPSTSVPVAKGNRFAEIRNPLCLQQRGILRTKQSAVAVTPLAPFTDNAAVRRAPLPKPSDGWQERIVLERQISPGRLHAAET